MVIRLSPDKHLRDLLFARGAKLHPAKMHLGFCLELVARYTREGDTVLDPMAGIGTTMVAALTGRNVVLVELEEHFVRPMLSSWDIMRHVGPIQGHQLGAVSIMQGDARALEFAGADSASALLTSPPYESHHQGGPDARPGSQQGGRAGRVQARYTDAVLTSPPYEQGLGHGGKANAMDAAKRLHARMQGGRYGLGENIGNLGDKAYWQSMTQIYRECFRVLKPGGVCIIVMKDIVRDHQIVPLVEQTRELLEDVGFAYLERVIRQISALSFWRILQTTTKETTTHGRQGGLFGDGREVTTVRRVRNGAPLVDTETALVMRKA